MIDFDDVAVVLGGQRVLDLPRLVIERGQVTAVVGDNGAGKSTLLHAAAGLLDLSRGRILLDGVLFHRGRAPAPRPLRQQCTILITTHQADHVRALSQRTIKLEAGRVLL